MIRIETEYENAQEKLDQQQETLQRQREQLEEMDLSDEEVERAVAPTHWLQGPSKTQTSTERRDPRPGVTPRGKPLLSTFQLSLHLRRA